MEKTAEPANTKGRNAKKMGSKVSPLKWNTNQTEPMAMAPKIAILMAIFVATDENALGSRCEPSLLGFPILQQTPHHKADDQVEAR